MAYATTTELAEYLGIDIADLPDDADRLLDRASDFIDYVTLSEIDTEDEGEEEAARKATCAQVEFWLIIDEQVSITGPAKSFSIGNFSMEFGSADGDTTLSQFSTRAYQYLFDAGLMSRGVAMI